MAKAQSLILMVAFGMLAQACGGDGSGPDGPTTITKLRGDDQIAAVASAVATSPAVVVEDASGTPVAGVSVIFAVASGGGTVTGGSAATDANGIATVGGWTLGPTAGANTVTAVVASLTPVTFSATATVPAPAASVEVEPQVARVYAGESLQLRAIVRDSLSNVLPGRSVTWSSSDPAIASVSASGLVTGHTAPGEATIMAQVDGKIGTLPLTVEEWSASVTVSPSTSEVIPGDTLRLLATPRDSRGNVLTGRAVAWSSDHPELAAVTASGLVRGVAAGSVIVTATVDGQHGFATITVLLSGSRLVVYPSQVAFLAGGSIQLGAFADPPAASLQLAWSSSDSTVARVSSIGQVTAGALGSATITATAPQGRGAATVTVVAPLVPASVVVGGAHSCALSRTGDAFCWGSGAWGQLGIGMELDRALPAPVVGGHRFTSLIAGDYATCGIDTAGTALCWGGDDHGELGFDLSDCPNSFYGCDEPMAVSGNMRFASLTGGWEHTCGLTAGGGAYCWGLSYWNQAAYDRGDPGFAAIESLSPVMVGGAPPFAQLTAGFYYTCGLTSAGQAWCWGLNDVGQLGDNSTTDRRSPVAVSGGLTFAALTTHPSAYGGTSHTCGLTVAGQAWCWGANDAGQLGDGSTHASSRPVAVTGGLTFAALSAGGSHTCGVTPGGAAYCWGANQNGQLGDGSTASRSTPVAVTGGLSFATVSAGGYQTCGITTSGTLYCWDHVPGPLSGRSVAVASGSTPPTQHPSMSAQDRRMNGSADRHRLAPAGLRPRRLHREQR